MSLVRHIQGLCGDDPLIGTVMYAQRHACWRDEAIEDARRYRSSGAPEATRMSVAAARRWQRSLLDDLRRMRVILAMRDEGMAA